MTPYPTMSDLELFHLLINGNRAAFTEIHNRYSVILYTYAYKKLRNREEAQDVVQEVFVKLWNNRLEIQLHTNLAGYLYNAVRNKAFDIFAHQKIELKYINSLQNYIAASPTVTDYLIREKQISALIDKEIAALPPRMREVFELSRKNHLSHKQIATLLNIAEPTVTTQIKRALRVLRLKLGLVFLSSILSVLYFWN